MVECLAAQRPELRYAGPTNVNGEVELDRPPRVAGSELLNGLLMVFSALEQELSRYLARSNSGRLPRQHGRGSPLGSCFEDSG